MTRKTQNAQCCFSAISRYAHSDPPLCCIPLLTKGTLSAIIDVHAPGVEP
jgi:hypothetical protein